MLRNRVIRSVLVLAVACGACDQPTEPEAEPPSTLPDLTSDTDALLQPAPLKAATSSAACVVLVGNSYAVTLSWSRLLVQRTWITDAPPVQPPGTELFNVYDEHTLDRAKRKGTHVAAIASFPTAALFFGPEGTVVARVACRRAN